jgi:DNA invertase Pin-like site-specific DNA recombinase
MQTPAPQDFSLTVAPSKMRPKAGLGPVREVSTPARLAYSYSRVSTPGQVAHDGLDRQAAEVRELIDSGLSLYQAAHELGVSHQTIKRRLGSQG